MGFVTFLAGALLVSWGFFVSVHVQGSCGFCVVSLFSLPELKSSMFLRLSSVEIMLADSEAACAMEIAHLTPQVLSDAVEV